MSDRLVIIILPGAAEPLQTLLMVSGTRLDQGTSKFPSLDIIEARFCNLGKELTLQLTHIDQSQTINANYYYYRYCSTTLSSNLNIVHIMHAVPFISEGMQSSKFS